MAYNFNESCVIVNKNKFTGEPMARRTFIVTAFILCICYQPAAGKQRPVVITARQCSYAEALAAKEIRRYIYLRTDELLSIVKSDGGIADISFIAVAEKDRDIVKKLTEADGKIKAIVAGLKPQEYLIKTVSAGNTKAVWIVGGDSAGVLYGTYRFIERFGVRFYLYGDVVPDEKINFVIPEIDEVGRPLFELRGILPFHDFPEGPDWWDVDEYKAVIGQLPKMRMNFIGLHTYPEKNPDCQFGNSEPTVWIGIPQDIGPDGTVKFSYPSRHFTTMSKAWGYKPKKTSEFSLGASELFERDDYGADYMEGMSPWPETPEKCNELFKRFGAVLNDAFSFAHRLDVKTCVGTEAALSEPNVLKQRLRDMGKDPFSSATVQEIYEGMFTRIKQAYPIDYYFLWTPEDWTWLGAKDVAVEAVVKDLKMATASAEKVKAPFTLATCGWVLGPQNNRTLFDTVLPKKIPLTCISRDVGFAFVEPGFAKVQGRPKWSIPWLEDDPALTMPQLWAGRMRRDAFDSLSYGCSGLMGIHWRTRIISPNIAALARAGWNQDFAKGIVSDPNKIERDPNNVPRDLPVSDFYADWAIAELGPAVAEPIEKLFAKLDGGPFSNVIGQRKTNLPRPATWIDGPGGIRPNETSWKEEKKNYAFVAEMANLRGEVKGAGNLERFDYWLNNFKYLREAGALGCIYGRFNKAVEKITAQDNPQERKKLAKEIALPIRREMAAKITDAHKYLLQTVNTTGEMGTVANWQERVIPKLLDQTRQKLCELTGEEIPEDKLLSKQYSGKARVFVPTVRTSVEAGENLRLKVIILDSASPKEAAVYWNNIGDKKYNKLELAHIGRGVYGVTIPAENVKQNDFEYHIIVTTIKGEKLYWPATAPRKRQTVIVVEASK